MPQSWMTEYVSIGFVGTSAKPIWQYETWKMAVVSLQPLVNLIPEPPALRMIQDDRKGGPKLGRIAWNDKGHRKWTHGSPDNSAESATWRFLLGEVWLPSWNKCSNPDRAPDLFLSMLNPFISKVPARAEYNQLFHIALPLDFARAHEETLRLTVSGMERVLAASHVVAHIRSWYESGKTMQDDLNNHLTSAGGPLNPLYTLPTNRDVTWKPFSQIKLA